jgi:hypothetical protein
MQGCSVQPAPGLAVLRRPGEWKGSTLGQETTRQVQTKLANTNFFVIFEGIFLKGKFKINCRLWITL